MHLLSNDKNVRSHLRDFGNPWDTRLKSRRGTIKAVSARARLEDFMPNEHLLAERRDGVLRLTLNQPDKLNALSDQMIAGLLEELGRAAQDGDARCILL